MLEIAGGIILGVLGLYALIWIGYGLLMLLANLIQGCESFKKEHPRATKVFWVLSLAVIVSIFYQLKAKERRERNEPVLVRAGGYAFVCQRQPEVKCVPQEKWKGLKPREVTVEEWAALAR